MNCVEICLDPVHLLKHMYIYKSVLGGVNLSADLFHCSKEIITFAFGHLSEMTNSCQRPTASLISVMYHLSEF